MAGYAVRLPYIIRQIVPVSKVDRMVGTSYKFKLTKQNSYLTKRKLVI